MHDPLGRSGRHEPFQRLSNNAERQSCGEVPIIDQLQRMTHQPLRIGALDRHFQPHDIRPVADGLHPVGRRLIDLRGHPAQFDPVDRIGQPACIGDGVRPVRIGAGHLQRNGTACRQGRIQLHIDTHDAALRMAANHAGFTQNPAVDTGRVRAGQVRAGRDAISNDPGQGAAARQFARTGKSPARLGKGRCSGQSGQHGGHGHYSQLERQAARGFHHLSSRFGSTGGELAEALAAGASKKAARMGNIMRTFPKRRPDRSATKGRSAPQGMVQQHRQQAARQSWPRDR